MATTFILYGMAGLFVSMVISVLWHLRWVRRLPLLHSFTVAERSASSTAGRVRCSVVIAGRNEEAA